MIKIGDRVINIDNITYIIDRNVFFNNGTSWVMTEPEIQDLLAILFNERTPLEKMIEETKKDFPKPAVKKAKKCKTNCGNYACDTGCKK
jgi:hypothetical protein